MTSLFRANMASLVLSSGQTTSRAVDVNTECYDAEAILVQAPADINSKTYTWEISLDNGTTYATLQDTAGANIVVPGVSKAITYNGILTAAHKFRLKANGAVGIDVTFLIGKSFRA